MTDELLIDTNEQDKRKKMAIGGASLLLMLGLFLVLTYRDYLDIGHLPISLVYMVLIGMIYRALRGARIIRALVCIALASALMFMAIAKFRWNQSYLEDLTTPHAFIFEDYIETYPRLEQHMFAATLQRPDWVRFAEECVEPALHGRPISSDCRNADVIDETYRINISQEMSKFLGRMQKTAQDVQDGRIKSGVDYLSCISEKRCAPIPLLPEEAKAEEVERDASKYAEIRTAFWDLVDDKGLTASVCDAMVLCKAMAVTGAVTVARIEAPDETAPLETAPLE